MRHAVWPTPAPPVTPHHWDQGDWQRFEDRYRPSAYAGGRYDDEAWERYASGVVDEEMRGQLRGYRLGEEEIKRRVSQRHVSAEEIIAGATRRKR